jgi:hypothetical protein
LAYFGVFFGWLISHIGHGPSALPKADFENNPSRARGVSVGEWAFGHRKSKLRHDLPQLVECFMLDLADAFAGPR